MKQNEVPPRVAILGSGWLGLPLSGYLAGQGYAVRTTYRTQRQHTALMANNVPGYFFDAPEEMDKDLLRNVDAVIFTLPPGGRRLGPDATPRYLECVRFVLDRLPAPPPHFVFTSSTGVYGDARGEVTEDAPASPTTESSRAVRHAEELLRDVDLPVTILRLAGLVGPGRHPGRFFGGRERAISAAEAPVNLVHRADVCSATDLVLRERLTGTYNVCAAAHPPKGRYYPEAAARLGLSVAGTSPGGADGKRVSSERLRGRGWQPRFDDLQI